MYGDLRRAKIEKSANKTRGEKTVRRPFVSPCGPEIILARDYVGHFVLNILFDKWLCTDSKVKWCPKDKDKKSLQRTNERKKKPREKKHTTTTITTTANNNKETRSRWMAWSSFYSKACLYPPLLFVSSTDQPFKGNNKWVSSRSRSPHDFSLAMKVEENRRLTSFDKLADDSDLFEV